MNRYLFEYYSIDFWILNYSLTSDYPQVPRRSCTESQQRRPHIVTRRKPVTSCSWTNWTTRKTLQSNLLSFFTWPGQPNMWPCHSLSQGLSHRIILALQWLQRLQLQQRLQWIHWLSNLVTQLTITKKLRDLNHDIGGWWFTWTAFEFLRCFFQTKVLVQYTHLSNAPSQAFLNRHFPSNLSQAHTLTLSLQNINYQWLTSLGWLWQYLVCGVRDPRSPILGLTLRLGVVHK